MNKIAHKEYKENEMRNYRKFDFASLRNSRLQNGFWGHRTENYMEIINSMLEALLDEENSARLLNFEIGAGVREGQWKGAFWSDGDCYKFLEGCLYVYQNTNDPKVLEIVEKYTKLIPLNQEKDGYLNTQVTLTDIGRWTDMEHHELYNAGHFFTLAAAHYDITGQDYLIKIARKFSDYLYGVFHTYPKELANFGFNPSQIMGLYDLYRVTENPKDIELAEIFVNMRGSSGNGTDQNQTRTLLREETKAVGHAVTSTYLYSGWGIVNGLAVTPTSADPKLAFEICMDLTRLCAKYARSSEEANRTVEQNDLYVGFGDSLVDDGITTDQIKYVLANPDEIRVTEKIMGPANVEYEKVYMEEVEKYLVEAQDLETTIKNIKERADEAIKKASN